MTGAVRSDELKQPIRSEPAGSAYAMWVGFACASLGVVTLAGWYSNVHRLKAFGPWTAVMGPMTATGFVLLGSSLSCRGVVRAPRTSRALAWILFALGFFGLVDHLSPSLGIASGFAVHVLGIARSSDLHPMAPAAAVSFVVLGIAVVATWRVPVPRWASVAAFVACVPPAVIFVAYLYGLNLTSSSKAVRLTVPGAIVLLAVSVTVWSLRGSLSALRLLVAPGPGGSMARRLIPAGIVIPLMLGWPRLVAFRNHVFGSTVSVALGQVEIAILFGTAVLWAAIAIDRMDTRRRTLAEALRESEDRYRIIIEGAAEGIWVSDSDGKTSLVNPRMAQMMGYSADELASLPLKTFIKDDPVAFLKRIDTRRRAGYVDRYEVELIRKDGSSLWVSVTANPLVSPSGEFLGSLALISDIGARKEAQAALQDAFEREREALERLRSIDEMKDAFLAAVSHELRTPLTGVLGFAATLQQRDGSLTEDEREMITERLVHNAERLQRLLSDLLDLDRLKRGSMTPHRRLVGIDELARGVAENVDIAGHILRIDVSPGLDAFLDAPKVERIIENLLTNAVRHTRPGSQIWLTAAPSDGGFILAVDDDGPGVDEQGKSVIFEPFQTGSARNLHSPGTGIGLSLVSRFAALHGGRSWIEDRPGGGSSFRVFLPRGEADAAHLDTGAA